MMAVFSRLLALPPALTTPAQRAAWGAFVPLIPELPVARGVLQPARVLSNGTHNSEAPEFFAVHPHRVFTRAREVAGVVQDGVAQLSAAEQALIWGGTATRFYGLDTKE
jgi:hypothetical protein